MWLLSNCGITGNGYLHHVPSQRSKSLIAPPVCRENSPTTVKMGLGVALGESKETTRATSKEFGAKTNGTSESNECKLDDAKMAEAAAAVISVRDIFRTDQTTQQRPSQKRVKERDSDNVNRNENCCHRLTVPANLARAHL